MSADDLGHVVAVGVDGVGVIPWEVSGVGTKTAAVGEIVPQRNCRELSTLAIVEKNAHREGRRKRRIVKGS